MRATSEKVFVYGTLRPPRKGTPPEDTRYFPLIECAVLRSGPAKMFGADLYDMGTFPAAVPGRGEIVGEILEVTQTAVDQMDEIEGDPYFYNREKVRVKTEAGEESAWIYWAPKGLEKEGVKINCGDWLRRKN